MPLHISNFIYDPTIPTYYGVTVFTLAVCIDPKLRASISPEPDMLSL